MRREGGRLRIYIKAIDLYTLFSEILLKHYVNGPNPFYNLLREKALLFLCGSHCGTLNMHVLKLFETPTAYIHLMQTLQTQHKYALKLD